LTLPFIAFSVFSPLLFVFAAFAIFFAAIALLYC